MLEVLAPSVLTTVQDAGRRGWQAFGVPVSGAMDAFALRAANLLVANPPGAAALEIGYSTALFVARRACAIAVTGAGFKLTVNERPLRLWTCVYVRENGQIRLDKTDSGNWAYLAIHGGIQTPTTLGSRAAYLSAQLGTTPARPLQPGDLLPTGDPTRPLLELASRHLLPAFRPAYALNPTLAVIPGPQFDQFPPEAQRVFFSNPYTISPISDRAGYRLEGAPIVRAASGEMLSEGMARGCIQVPANGQPIVMQADCPTAGGYPKIAAVISADQPILAQTPIGAGQIRFTETTIEQAQTRYRESMRALETGITQPVDDDYSW
jgi:antagonist of KipI